MKKKKQVKRNIRNKGKRDDTERGGIKEWRNEEMILVKK